MKQKSKQPSHIEFITNSICITFSYHTSPMPVIKFPYISINKIVKFLPPSPHFKSLKKMIFNHQKICSENYYNCWQ